MCLRQPAQALTWRSGLCCCASFCTELASLGNCLLLWLACLLSLGLLWLLSRGLSTVILPSGWCAMCRDLSLASPAGGELVNFCLRLPASGRAGAGRTRVLVGVPVEQVARLGREDGPVQVLALEAVEVLDQQPGQLGGDVGRRHRVACLRAAARFWCWAVCQLSIAAAAARYRGGTAWIALELIHRVQAIGPSGLRRHPHLCGAVPVAAAGIASSAAGCKAGAARAQPCLARSRAKNAAPAGPAGCRPPLAGLHRPVRGR